MADIRANLKVGIEVLGSGDGRDEHQFIELPDHPTKWKKAMQNAWKDGGIQMVIDNLGTGGEDCAIGFFPIDDDRSIEEMIAEDKGFAIYLNKETLEAVRRAINFAADNFID